MKIANFTSILNWDSSWTGGSVVSYDAYKNLADTINNFTEKHTLEIVKIDYTEINGYRQHGPSEKNRDVFTKVIATVYYNGELNIYKCSKCLNVIVEQKEDICNSCQDKDHKEFMEKYKM